MSLEQQVAALVTASNNLTSEVAGKQAAIDAKVAAKINELEAWRLGVRSEMALPFSVTVKVGGDANTFYPVPIFGAPNELCRLVIARRYNEPAPVSLGATHVAGLLLELSVRGSGWSDFNLTRIECYQFAYHQAVGGVIPFQAGRLFWLRGGGMEYRILSDYYLNPGSSSYGTENLKPILVADTPIMPEYVEAPFAGGGYKVSPKSTPDLGWDAAIVMPKVI